MTDVAQDTQPKDPWDLSDPANPQPLIWPQCTHCGNQYVYRWGMRFGGPSGFYWMADCSGKKHPAQPQLTTHNGPYSPPGGKVVDEPAT